MSPVIEPPSAAWANAFAERLLAWYGRERRDLPWRRNRDPYRIWVSEAMLQQTRVDTAIPYFERFLAFFPTPAALAAAGEEQVLKAWEGLGYYARARHLQAAVREVEDRYGGRVPLDPEAFRALPGVGPYMAGAVLSIAYDLPLPAVDGNVMRVFARLLLLREDPARPAVRRALEGLIPGLMPPGRAGDFNQALMELGALVCLPRTPRCGDCPVAALCGARATGEQTALPLRRETRAVPEVRLVAAVVRAGGRVLIRRRPDSGLLAGLWEFPNWPVTGEDTHWQVLQRGMSELGLAPAEWGRVPADVGAEPAAPVPATAARPSPLIRVRHAFSHLRWDLAAYLGDLPGEVPAAPRPGYLWAGPEDLASLAFPAPMARVSAAARQAEPFRTA